MERPRTRGIQHLNIGVRDPTRSSEFYGRVFGMEEAFSEMPRAIFLKCGDDLLTLSRTRKRTTKVGIHFGFRARDREEFAAWKEWLAENKVRVTHEREEEGGGGVYLRDPDGYKVEIYYETE